MVQREIKIGFRQFIALMLIITMISPVALSAKRKKHGARVKVVKLDGQLLEGELLYVKDTELILMNNSKVGITIPLNEIKEVKLKKKGKFLSGFLLGVGAWMIVGGFLGESQALKEEGYNFASGAILCGAIYGVPTGSIFGALNALSVKYKTFSILNKRPEKVSKILKKLKSKARFK